MLILVASANAVWAIRQCVQVLPAYAGGGVMKVYAWLLEFSQFSDFKLVFSDPEVQPQHFVPEAIYSHAS